MGNAISIGKLAVGVIFFAILVGIAVGIYRMNIGVQNEGTKQLSESSRQMMETTFTQYQDRVITGTETMQIIKTYWKDGNTAGVIVSTKDGTNVLYDFTGTVGKDGDVNALKTFTGYPTKDAVNNDIGDQSGQSNETWLGSLKIANYEKQSADIKDTIFSAASGYECSNMSEKGFINPTAGFKGSVLRDANNNPRCLMFIQQN